VTDPKPADQEHPSESSAIKSAVRRGARALGLAQVASQVLSMATLVAMYRILADPEPFGLVGMVLPLVLLLRSVSSAGLQSTTVQAARWTAGQLTSLFWWQCSWGLAATAITAALAPALSSLYGDPRVLRLTLVMAGMSLATAIGAQHQALLERHLLMRPLAACRLTAQAAGSVAGIGSALAGWGVYALVAQFYVELLLLAILSWSIEPWRPGWPGSGAPVGRGVRAGGYFSAAGLLYYIANHADKVLLGATAGASALGLYSQAFNIMIKPVYLVTTPLTALLLAGLSRAAGDFDARRELLVSFYRLTAILLIPVGVGLSVVGVELMPLLGGQAWRPAGPLLSILSLSIVAQGFVILVTPILTACGRTDRLLQAAAVVTLLFLQAYTAAWWFGSQFGDVPQAFAWSYSLVMLLVVPVPYTLFALHTIGQPIRPLLRVVARPASSAMIMGLVVWVAGNWLSSRLGLAEGGLLVAQIVVGVVVFAWLARADVAWLWRQMIPSSRIGR